MSASFQKQIYRAFEKFYSFDILKDRLFQYFQTFAKFKKMYTKDDGSSFKPEVRLLTGKTAKASISQSSIFLHLLQLLHIQTQLKNNVCN